MFEKKSNGLEGEVNYKSTPIFNNSEKFKILAFTKKLFLTV